MCTSSICHITLARLLEQRRITAVVVVDGAQRVLGVVHLHDLWRIEMF